MRNLMVFFVSSLLLTAAPVMAIPVNNTVTNIVVGPGTSTYSWTQVDIPLDFQVPSDTLNSATLSIISTRAAGNNDVLSYYNYDTSSYVSLGALGASAGQGAQPFTTNFNLLSSGVFNNWASGNDLLLRLSYVVGGGLPLTMSSVVFAMDYDNPPAPPVPEPATFLLLGSGLAGLGYIRRKVKA